MSDNVFHSVRVKSHGGVERLLTGALGILINAPALRVWQGDVRYTAARIQSTKHLFFPSTTLVFLRLRTGPVHYYYAWTRLLV